MLQRLLRFRHKTSHQTRDARVADHPKSNMQAVVISKPGPADVLVLAERPTPIFRESEILIRVKAAGVNRADIIQREGRYPAPAHVASDIPGLEVAGIVEACGSNVQRWKPG